MSFNFHIPRCFFYKGDSLLPLGRNGNSPQGAERGGPIGLALMRQFGPIEVDFAEMCLWRQMLTQYLEKIDPDLLRLLRGKMSLMAQYRVHTGNTLGCAALVLATEGLQLAGVDDDELEAASIAQCLSMDMAKEALGTLQSERTETVAGDRFQLKRELCWVYARCTEDLQLGRNGRLMCRFASSGLHYVPIVDRYLGCPMEALVRNIPASTWWA